jgi:fluoroquinolone transport system permease protein
MTVSKAIKGLGMTDLKTIQRDSFLGYLIILPIVYALLIRWLTPLAADAFVNFFDLTLYYPLIVSFVIVVITPMLMGTAIGFLLLDERDERTLTALLVTPLPLTVYLVYRIAIPTILSVILTLINIPIAGLVDFPFWSVVAIALVAALSAPIVALFFFCFAENKVQGFGLLKAIGTVGFLIPIAAYFIPEPWQYGMGIFPHYWVAKTVWILGAGETGFWLYWLVGLAVNLVTLKLFVDRFEQIAYR